MFTGLIEDVGEVAGIRRHRDSAELSIRTRLPLRDLAIGASIAVNGACLTVVGKSRGSFTVDVSGETLARTNLDRLVAGDPVNLERSMRLGDRLGGHLVTGHVDGLATVTSIDKSGDFTFLRFRVPAHLGALIVTKGSVAVDGISLTVNERTRTTFSVAIIPFTLRNTNLRGRRVGDRVNIETDLIGKYVCQLMKQR